MINKLIHIPIFQLVMELNNLLYKKPIMTQYNKFTVLKTVYAILYCMLIFFSCSPDPDTSCDPCTNPGCSCNPSPGQCNECPVIRSVSPSSGYEGDTVTISGTKFNNLVRVTFDKDLEATILSKTNTEIKVKVPNVLPATKDSVEVNVKKLDNNVEIGALAANKGSFKYLMASISNFIPTSAYEGDTVELKGQKIDQIAKVFFDNLETPVFLSGGKYLVKIPFVNQINTNNVQIKGLQINSRNILIGNTLEFKYNFPAITSVIPTEGFAGDTVELKGNRLDLLEKLTINNQNIAIGKTNLNVYKIIIPIGTNTNVFSTEIHVLNKSLNKYPADAIKFTIIKEHISGFSRDHIGNGANVSIYGKFKHLTPNLTVHHGDRTVTSINTKSKDSLRIKLTNCGTQTNFVFINKGTANEVKSQNKLFFIPPDVKVSRANFTIPDQERIENLHFATSSTNIYISGNDNILKKSFCYKVNINSFESNCRQNPFIGRDNNIPVWIGQDARYKFFVRNIAVNDNFIYLLKDDDQYTRPGDPLPIFVPTEILRLNNLYEVTTVKYNPPRSNQSTTIDIDDHLEIDENDNLFYGPVLKVLYKYGNISEKTIDTSFFNLFSMDAGTAKSKDKFLFAAGGKIYSIANDLTTIKLEYDNPANYSIKNLAVNKYKTLELIIFQDKGDQKVVVYNTVTKMVTEYASLGQEFSDLCIDKDDWIYGINNNGIYILEEN